jgi:predicted metal-dependent hydrolase
MTEDQIKAQQLQDMLEGAINQRNHHENECLQLHAQLAKQNRALAAALAEVEVLTKKLAEATTPAETPLPNGDGAHLEEAA